MTMELLPADYVLCGLAIVLCVTGLFRGFSGTLAFFAACAAAACTAAVAWPYTATLVEPTWQRGALALVATLLAFGVSRMIVKRCVNGLLAQPSDAIMGAIVGLVIGALIVAGWGFSGLGLEYSNLATEASRLIGGEVVR